MVKHERDSRCGLLFGVLLPVWGLIVCAVAGVWVWRPWRRAYLDASRFVQFCAHHADEQPDSLWVNAFYEIDERRYILGFEGDDDVAS